MPVTSMGYCPAFFLVVVAIKNPQIHAPDLRVFILGWEEVPPDADSPAEVALSEGPLYCSR
jgi:hypothetical protein